MATIEVDAFVSASFGGASAGLGVRGTITRSGDNYVADNQNIGTSAEVVTIGDCATGVHAMLLKNADATNYVTLYQDGASAAKQIGKLYPGQFAFFFVANGVSIGAKASTAPCILEKVVFENVATASGGLSVYSPSAPSAGYSTAQITLTATVGSVAVAASATSTEAITGAGLLAPWACSDSGYTELWPDTALLAGGNNYGTVMAINTSVDDKATLADGGGSSVFGEASAFNGFVIMPQNHTTAEHSKAQGDGAVVNLLSVATRKTI